MQCLGLQQLPFVSLVAVADLRQEAMEHLARQLSTAPPHFYTDAVEMMAKENLDLVCIATTAPAHMPLAQAAIQAGIPRIIVEKPVGTQIAEVRSVIGACTERGIRLTVDHNRRWWSDYALIKAWIQQGEIGPLRQVYVPFGHGGFANIGVHYFDLVRYLTESEAAWVIGFLEEDSPEATKRGSEFYDPGGYGLIGLANGVRFFIDLSGDLKYREQCLILKCERGRIEVDEKARQWTVVSHASNQVLRQVHPFRGSTEIPVSFAKAAAETLSESSLSSTGEDGLAALEMAMGMHLSHQRGHQAVKLPLEGADAEVRIRFA